MKWRLPVLLLLFPAFLWLIVTFCGAAHGQVPGPLSLETHISLANVAGRIDHLAVDIKGQRLFVAAVENHSVEVVDLKSRKRVLTIAALAEPQGVFYDEDANRLFVACALDGAVKIFDGSTFQLITTIKYPDDADNIRYDTRGKHVIVGYAGAKQLRKRDIGAGGLGFIDSNGRKIRDIVIDAHPESFQLERQGTRLFVNVPERREIEVIDLANNTVVDRWPIIASENNFPMALDEKHHRVFVGCWTPPLMLAFDTETGKQVAANEIAGKSDDLFYDSLRDRIYVLTTQGLLEVFQQKSPDLYGRIARYPTRKGTQTGLFVPEWGQLFAAQRQQGTRDAEIIVYQAH